MRNAAVLGLLVIPLIACASTTTNDGASASADETSATSDVPEFTIADHLDDFEFRMRVSIDGAPFIETSGLCSTDGFHSGPQAFRCAAGIPGNGAQLNLQLGDADHPALEVGTYATTNDTALVMEFDWSSTPSGAMVVKRSTSSTITVDSSVPFADDYRRVIGRFDASSDGLGRAMKGTFYGTVFNWRCGLENRPCPTSGG